MVLGEHTLDSHPDCLQKFCAPPVQVIDVDEVVIHEQFRPRAAQVGYDIALVRMKELALLSFVRMIKITHTKPREGVGKNGQGGLKVTPYGLKFL